MKCKKCQKEISDDSIFCNYCGIKQENTEEKTNFFNKEIVSAIILLIIAVTVLFFIFINMFFGIINQLP